MDEWLTSYILFTVLQLYQDDVMEIMRGCVQWKPVIGWKDSRLQDSRLQRDSNQGMLEQQRFTYWATGLPKVYEACVHRGSNLTALK